MNAIQHLCLVSGYLLFSGLSILVTVNNIWYTLKTIKSLSSKNYLNKLFLTKQAYFVIKNF